MLCFRLFNETSPAAPLADAVAQLREGQGPKDLYAVEPASFQQIPNAPFAYWVSEHIRRLFVQLPAFENDERAVRVGLQTSDDFRFIRLVWESQDDDTWFPFVKGGAFSRYYSDVSLLVNWSMNGSEMKRWSESIPGNNHWTRNLRNTESYFLPGLTWPLRGASFSAQAVGSGSIFSIPGKLATVKSLEELFFMLGIFNTQVFDALIRQMAGLVGGAAYEAGLIARVPVQSIQQDWVQMNPLVSAAWSTKRRTDTATLTSHAFHTPALAPGRKPTAC